MRAVIIETTTPAIIVKRVANIIVTGQISMQSSPKSLKNTTKLNIIEATNPLEIIYFLGLSEI